MSDKLRGCLRLFQIFLFQLLCLKIRIRKSSWGTEYSGSTSALVRSKSVFSKCTFLLLTSSKASIPQCPPHQEAAVGRAPGEEQQGRSSLQPRRSQATRLQASRRRPRQGSVLDLRQSSFQAEVKMPKDFETKVKVCKDFKNMARMFKNLEQHTV